MRQILKEVDELLTKKAEDYGTGSIDKLWEEFGTQFFIIYLSNKLERMKNLCIHSYANFESLEDTIMDMIGYLTLMHEKVYAYEPTPTIDLSHDTYRSECDE